jgi:tetratricopeptide (TPR) repeat protein
MKRQIFSILGICCAMLAGCGYAEAQAKHVEADESVMLGLSKLSLGTISGLEEKRQFLTTVQLEKQRIEHNMLNGIYEDAFDLYKQGQFERASELAGKILAIDPNYHDAQLLIQASGRLQSSGPNTAGAEHEMIGDKFDEAMSLYRQGRVIEASSKWEEVLKLSPNNMKAQYWLKKARSEIADEYMRRGDDSYAKRNLRDAVDQWYNALLLNKNDQKLVAKIAKAENELNQQEANRSLQQALELYGQGNLTDAYAALKRVLEVQPGDAKAQKLVGEVRGEIAGGFITEGKKSYASHQYPQAINSWTKARDWGYDSSYVAQLVARAKEQMRREDEVHKEEAEAKEKAAAEEAARKQKEAEEATKAAMQDKLTNSAVGSEASTATTLPNTGPKTVTEENRRAAIEHYRNGLKSYQDGDMEKAREEWTAAQQLDPNNGDVKMGLERINQAMGGQ